MIRCHLTLVVFLLTSLPLGAGESGFSSIRTVKGQAEAGEVVPCRLRGTVTLGTGVLDTPTHSFYLDDGTGGISVIATRSPELRPGDRVEVRGSAAWTANLELEVHASDVRKLGVGIRPVPVALRPEQLLDPANLGRLVEVQGQVAALSIGETRDGLTLWNPSTGLVAYVRRLQSQPSILAKTLAVGSEVRATGILLPSSRTTVQLRLRNSGDVSVLRAPSIFHSHAVRTAVGVVAAVVSLGAIWLFSLRRTLKHKTAEIRHLLKEAQSASEMKSQFLANVSHEIRTPMNGILGLTDLVLKSPLTGEQRESLEMVHSSAESLLTIINDLLDYSKIDAGKLDVQPHPFQLELCVRSAVELLALAAESKQLTLTYEVREEVRGWVLGDDHRLRQVLVNLLGNAIKFTAQGSVTLTVYRAGEGDLIRFDIDDTGIGIPADKMEAIFEPFHQADGSVSRRFGGTGLGLAISRKIVALLGGELRCANREGQTGAVFFFTAALPGTAEPLAEKPHWQVERPPVLRVLVAEDNHVNRLLAKRILEKRGHAVLLANSGKEALQQWHLHKPDLILMDVQMPEMDGFEATRQIRGAEYCTAEHVPILALTANAMVQDRDRCLASGMDGYLSKPFRSDELIALIERTCPPDAARRVIQ